MDNPNTMSRLLIALLLVSGTASADCFLRSSSISRAAARIERMTDVQYTMLPAEAGKMRCRVTFRALIDNQWHTAEGENVGGPTEDSGQVCAHALDIARSSTLTRIAGVSTDVAQEMICTDQPIPKSREMVNVGDMIRDSEVQPHPVQRRAFQYKGSECRWFVESRPESGRVDMNQGIICRVPGNTGWRVVDKW